MLNNYIKAENLKCKRTFAKKSIFIAPLCTVMLGVFSGKYFVQNGYNWWYILILPGFISLLTALINQNEEKRLKYRAVFALPVSLRKTWISKNLLIVLYTALANIIHLLGIILGILTYNTASTTPVYQIIAASVILIVTSIWQIPLCLFLSKKFGLTTTILINFAVGTVLNIFAASKSFWWVCPYSWSTRLMCPVLGILPEGVFAESGNPLLNPAVIPVGIILSVVLFMFLLAVTAIWFSKKEVK